LRVSLGANMANAIANEAQFESENGRNAGIDPRCSPVSIDANVP
jgi:hypothetical protein